MLQHDLEMRQELGRGIGAKLRRMAIHLESLFREVPEGVSDLVEMLTSVTASLPEDDMDGTTPDEVDAWMTTWTTRIRQWMDLEVAKLSQVIEIPDSHDNTVEEAERMEFIFVEMVVALQRAMGALMSEVEKARLRKSAAVEQAWDDWAVQNSMEEGPSPKRHRTVRTQVDAEMLAEENVNGAANDGSWGPGGEFAREVVGENRNGSGVNLEVDDRTMAECDERRLRVTELMYMKKSTVPK